MVMIPLKMTPRWINLLLLSLVFYDTSAINKNYDIASSGVNKRQVKLYSGERPKPIVCLNEGFQEDPNDCSAFHRCIKSGNGRYVSYKFQCGPGTIYDPDAEICNHPHSTTRTGCRAHFQIATKSIQNNEVVHELPSPITTKAPVFKDIITTQVSNENLREPTNKIMLNSLRDGTYLKPQSTNMVTTSTAGGVVFSNTPSASQITEPCVFEGFMGDREDCQKFYRCVGNHRGGFIRYEFLCSNTTIWDDDKKICNLAQLVINRRCGRDNKITNEITNSNYENAVQNQLQVNYGTKLNNNKLNDMRKQQFSNSFAQIVSQNELNHSNKKKPTQIPYNDSLNGLKQTESQLVEITNNMPSSLSSKQNYDNECTESGFMRNPNNCKLFYRCVNNGRGSFTRYEFSCGEGTVWDPKIESCNHAWAVKECEGSTYINQSSEVTMKTTQKTTTEPFTASSIYNNYTSNMPIVDENYDNAYQSQIPPMSTNQTIEKESTTTTQAVFTNRSRCHSNGFFGDNADCKKFYRCVDNGNGKYIQYEFICGDGTVWDPKIEACNHAWAVEKCGENNYFNNGNSTSSITQTFQSSTLSTLQTTSEINDNDVGYGHQSSESSAVISITVTSESTADHNGCISDGFIGDSKDCKKFYRCVGNGNGAFTKYEFSCGEGTVWDPTINSCNHAWAVENCGGHNDVSNIETTTHNITENTKYTSTATYHTDDDNDVGYGQQNNYTTISSVTHTESEKEINNQCTSSGFLGDINDCKKFYRCVDNGRGGFTRFEFSCGEGTVWDPKIESCNHAWAVEKCGSDNKPQSSSEATQIIVEDENPIGYPTQSDESHIEMASTLTPTATDSTTSSVNNICMKSGFIGDSNDCKKFYRCVDNGQGGYVKYEFTCGEGTLWDQTIESCNHEWAVSNCTQTGSHGTTSTVNPADQEYNQQSTETAISSSPVPPFKNKCSEEGFYGNTEDCRKFFRCVQNGQDGFTKYEFTCGDGTFWDQEILACNHNADQCKSHNISLTSTTMESNLENTVSSTTGPEYVTQLTQNESNNHSCISEGYFANPIDCQQFYRCVSNDQGSFTKYDFTCGQGTIWVQEILACDHDNDMNSCNNSTSSLESETTSQDQLSSVAHSSTKSPNSDKDNDEYNEGLSEKPHSESDQCKSEGFFANKKNCTKFYRCVNNGNGGFTKYDFTCGDGTAWDSSIQSCNHIHEVDSCRNIEESQTKPISHDEGTSTSTEDNSTPGTYLKNNTCKQEGFFGNAQDCTKFYRCVDNGKGGFIKYDFDCGEGTIWDQDLTTCNHPEDVSNPACNETQKENSSSTGNMDNINITSTSANTANSLIEETTESNNNTVDSSCTEENSNNSQNENEKCEKAGYYADPNDCKKFYRCVDWHGNGEQFSVFHFECGEGTIWDPTIETCNHKDSVYPSRNCSGIQNENNTQETITTQKSTTESTTSHSRPSDKPTQETTTSYQTTQLTTNEETTNQSPIEVQTTTLETISQKETTTTETTTQDYSSEKTTTQQASHVDESTTTQSSAVTTTIQTTTQQTSTEQVTECENTSSTEHHSSTTEQSSTITEKTDEPQTTGDTTTTEKYSPTTEYDQISTTEAVSNKDCPETENDQYLYVCPTSFRRHPKYCNMFYQCLEDEESHDLKIATFTCPNNTIYDENKVQCVEEQNADKKCEGQKARKYRVKRLKNFKEPIEVDRNEHKCRATGNYGFDKDNECSRIFLKCLTTKSNKLRGFVYQCPEGYVYWSISKRCEKTNHMKYCQTSKGRNWTNRWEIPMELKNIAK